MTNSLFPIALALALLALKFAMVTIGESLVGSDRIINGFVTTRRVFLAIRLQSGSPFAKPFFKIYPFVAARVVDAFFAIPSVLLVRGDPKVFKSVVMPRSIDVVNLAGFRPRLGHVKPRKTMREYVFSGNAYPDIPVPS